MHFSRMCTICCSGHLSCHACPLLPCMPPCHACPLPHMPPAMHTSLPCMLPTMHAPHHAWPLPCDTPTTHALPCMLPAMNTPLPHMPPHHVCSPCHTCLPVTHVNRITDACENITLLQLRCGRSRDKCPQKLAMGRISLKVLLSQCTDMSA